MADLAELHEELAGLFGLTLAARQLVRKVAALADQENEYGLVQVLQQLDSAAEQVEQRCQALIARHAGLRPARITASARKVKTGVLDCCPADATARNLLELLAGVLSSLQVSATALSARGASNDKAVAEFADFLVFRLDAVRRRCRHRALGPA